MKAEKLIFTCECGWKGKYREMRRIYDVEYDQSDCPECGTVLVNNFDWEVHCKSEPLNLRNESNGTCNGNSI